MKIKVWPNKLGFDLTYKGRKWEVWNPIPIRQTYGVRHFCANGNVLSGEGKTWPEAIANAKPITE